MSDTFESLRRQLAEAEKNRRLIQERKAEYAQATDIPLQLVKDERQLEEQVADAIMPAVDGNYNLHKRPLPGSFWTTNLTNGRMTRIRTRGRRD